MFRLPALIGIKVRISLTHSQVGTQSSAQALGAGKQSKFPVFSTSRYVTTCGSGAIIVIAVFALTINVLT